MAFLRRFAVCTFALLLGAGSALAQTTPAHIADLQNWPSGLPAAATWNVVGFNTTWQANQIRAGHRLLPSIYLAMNGASTSWNSSSNQQTANGYLNNYSTDITYLSANRVPICLRTNNLTSTFTQPQYNLPLDPSTIPQSIFTWDYNSSGILEQGSSIDTFGPDQAFQTEGSTLGSSLYLQTLQNLYPNPPWVQFLENNEGVYDDFLSYTVDANQDAFLPLSTIYSKSIRLGDFLTANPSLTPSGYATQFYTNRQRKFGMFYAAFDAALTPAWQGKTRTAAYKASMPSDGRIMKKAGPISQIGYVPEALSYDGGSKSLYISQGYYSDFTALNQADIINQIPAWQWLEARNPRHHREFSLQISNGGVMAGAKAGKHLVITPARYEGWIQWLLWSIRDQGVPVIVRYWNASSTLPTDPFFNVADWTYLQSQGLSTKINNLTQQDYVLPLMTSVDRICNDATLRKYWVNGQPVVAPSPSPTDIYLQKMGAPPYPQTGDLKNNYRVLTCDVNTTSSAWKWDTSTNQVTGVNKVWAVAVVYNNKALLYAWSPCKLSGTVKVTIPGMSTVSIAVPQPWGYWEVSGTTATKLNLTTTLPLN